MGGKSRKERGAREGEATGLYSPQNDKVNKKEVMEFRNELHYRRDVMNPQAIVKGDFMTKGLYQTGDQTGAGQGLHKDFKNMKLMIYI
jgi:hypothetical protein